jgi:hypothetical protein
VVGPYPVWDAWFLIRLLLVGTRCIYIFWVVTDDVRYAGYKTPIVAPEPSIEWVAGAIHLMEGRIGTHMILRVPPRDSEV